MGGRSHPPACWAEPSARPRLSLEEQVGQVIMGVWSGDTAHLAGLIAHGRVGALLVPPGAVAEPADLAATLNRLQRLATYPLLVAADLTTATGSAVLVEQALGATHQPVLARRCGALGGARARALGVHLLLSPCLDVRREPGQAVGDGRSFGENPSLVANLGAAFVEGCRSSRVLAVGHYFPGRGGALYDASRRLSVVPHDRQTLEKIDLLPYVAAREAGLGAVMSGHMHVAALDNLPNRLATHSSAVVAGLLRGTLRFGGLLLSDNLDAPEVSARYSPGQAAILAFAAGHDLVVTESPGEVYRALYEVLLQGDIAPARLQEAVGRIWAAKQWLGLPNERFVPTPPPAAKEYGGLAQEVARAALTLVHGRREPLIGRRPVVLANRARRLDGSLLEADLQRLAATHLAPVALHFFEARPAPAQIDAALTAAGAEAALIFFDRAGAPEGGTVGEAMVAVAQALKRMGLPVGVVVMGNPYVLPRFRQADLLLHLPGDAPPFLEAALAYLLGRIEAPGRLPVTLAGLAD